jgi:calcineurin-like phosphoesterase family protein
MTRYVVSDHHFGHANIIEYCDRPFTSVGEMNDIMLDRYYAAVGTDDVLVHLGDLAMDMSDGTEIVERFHQLDADLLVRGNHDVGLSPADAPFPMVESCVLEHAGYEFYCTHRPEDAPDDWEGWVLHGHHHDNDIESYPFVHYDAERVNVGVELLDYRPVSLDALTDLLDRCVEGDHIRDLAAAQRRL